MIEFRCGQCREDIAVPDSLAGQTETCPKCHALNRIPTPIQGATAEPSENTIVTEPKHRRKRMVLALIASMAIAAIAVGGYFAAIHFGPEHWRIDSKGRSAYAALYELHMSVQTPIDRDEYGQYVRRALVVVSPYLQSENAKACPEFADWVGKTMTCHVVSADKWNEPIPDNEMVALMRLNHEIRILTVKKRWEIAGRCFVNTSHVIEGEPDKIQPLAQSDIDEIAGKNDVQKKPNGE